MLNKLLSVLIIVLLFSGIYFFYYYFFVLNKWNLTLNSNVWGYEVGLYNKDLKTTFNSSCENEKCELVDIAPFSYTLSISKDWYKTITSDIKIQKKSTLELSIYLEKDLKIEKVETQESSWSTSEEAKNTAQQKIDQIRSKRNLEKKYRLFDEQENGYFYFDDNWNETLSLYREKNWDTTKIYDFEKINAKLINLWYVYNSLDNIFLKYDKKLFIFDLKAWTSKDLEFYPEINYAKKDSNIISFVTDLWTYNYDENTQTLEYFYFFKDFLYYWNDSYLWVIFSDEEDKKKNYNFQDYKWNLIVKYNFKTKQIKVLKETDINVSKVLNEKWEIYFYDKDWWKYLVSNIE